MERRVGLVELDFGSLDRQLPALRHGVAGVDRQVEQHLLDLARVGSHGAQALLQRRDELDVLADQPSQHLVRVAHDLVQVDDARLEHLLAAEGEELPRQVGRAMRGLVDLGQLHPRRVLRLQPSGGELRVAQDGRQQVVEVVGDAAGQPSHRFHLLRLAELLFDGAALRHVPRVDDQPASARLGRRGLSDHRQGPPGTV